MTSPIDVGSVEVSVVADSKALLKGIREDVEKAFKGLDDKVKESLGKDPIKVPVKPEVDPKDLPKSLPSKKPSVPQEKPAPVKVPPLDPLAKAFAAEIKRQTDLLARQVIRLPVEADTSGLRAELGSELAAVAKQVRAKIPTEPGDQAAYRAQLQAQLAEVARRVKASVPVEPDAKAGFEAKLRATVAEASARVKAHVKVDVDKDTGLGLVKKLGSDFQGLIPDIGGVGGAVRGLISTVGDFAGQAALGGGRLAGAMSAAAGPIGIVVSLLVSAGTAIAALGVGATLLVPALTAAAGAAAAIPAALSGVGALLGTFTLGLKGISEAFKPKTGGGGGSSGIAGQARQIAAAGRQVAAAQRGIVAANRSLEASYRSLAAAGRGVEQSERSYARALESLADAQKKAKAAQDAISKARREAAEDIDDLKRSLRGAQIGEKEAAQAVNDALLALNEAKLTGNIPDIERAQNAYDRAVLSLEDARDATEDLQEQSDEAAKAGVDGSDKVQQALQDQVDATRAVRDAADGVVDAQNGMIDAADGLKSAQDGVASALDGVKSATDGLKSAQEAQAAAQQKQSAGASALASQLIKLAPNAQKFVDAIKAIKPAFEALRLDVQQRLFAGLDDTVTTMWKRWKDQLGVTLGSFADSTNLFLKNLGASLSTPEFVKQAAAGAEGFRQGLVAIGDAITKSLVPAFGDLSEAAGPFLKTLGDEVAGIVTDFGNWIQKAKDDGSLQSFFDRASAALHDIFRTGKLVGQIIGDLIATITGPDEDTGKSSIDSFNDGLQTVHDWLSDPENQQKIRDFVKDVSDALIGFGQLAAKIDGFFDNLSDDTDSEGIGTTIGKALVSGLVAGLALGVKENVKFIFGLFAPPGPVIKAVKDAFGIKSPSTVMADIGKDLIRGLINGIVGWFASLKTTAGNIKTTVVNALSTAGTWLYNTGKNAVIGAGNGINSLLGSLGRWAGNIRVTVINSLSNAGSWLVSTGKNAVIGLWNGVASLGGWLWNKVVNFARNNIEKAWNWALDIGSPSRLTFGIGRYVSQGLALGIEAEGDRVQAAADKVAALAVPQVDATLGLGAEMDAAISRSLQVSDRQQLQAAWKPGSTGDPLLDALRNLIQFKHNGDPVAALSS